MISARELTRQFKAGSETVDAVRGLTLDVKEGELVAFLGPNGAGKSTSVRMLTTLLPPTSGSARVAGCDVATDPVGVRRCIGYVGQGTGSGRNHIVRDELISQGQAQRMSTSAAKARADELLVMLELNGLGDRVASTLSGGQQRRLDICLGLMHRPRILFLDEPSTGLDPHSRANLWEHILKLRKETGMTIFLTTHYLDEADSMAQRVMVMDHGRIIADDTPERLKADLTGDRITISSATEVDACQVAEVARGLTAAAGVLREGNSVQVTVRDGAALLPEFIRRLHQLEIRILAASVKRPTLDDVFLRLTGRSLRETAAG